MLAMPSARDRRPRRPYSGGRREPDGSHGARRAACDASLPASKLWTSLVHAGPNIDATELLPIGEIARRSGVATAALRDYEERGLITSERIGSGHGRYPGAVL